ncbi:cytochrome P450 9e2-like [Copidosoma floridanum]|uniref:cytochrome P450 9e2-like n=1 Tax=Copidosoma floridanum TaxID=29053 RepID=UPI0006C97A39|nr:cytochrome P450 9e2-like [Copidosoma floridanum]
MALLNLLLLVFVGCVLFLIHLLIRQHTYWKSRKLLHVGFPPIINMNTALFFRQRSFPEHSKFLHSLHPNAKYYGTFDFNTPAIVVKDPELIRDIFIKNFEYFPDHRSFVTEEMDPIVGRNVFSLKGQRWKDVRSTLSPSFTANKMKFMFQLVSECSREFVQYFVNNPDSAKNVEAKDAFTRYTNDVIATAAFGIQVNSMRDRENEFYVYGKDATSFGTVCRLIKFMLFRAFPNVMRMSGEKFLSRSTDRFFKQLVTNTVKTREEKGIVRPDMIHLLMQAKDKKDGIEFTIDDIIGQAFIFFLAGFDVSSTLMCFVAYELAAHPEIQERVQEDIDKQLEQENGLLTYESLGRIKYLDMVINETLRKYPPTPMTDRVCAKEFVIPSSMDGYPEYKVEVGTNIIMPIYGLHHDPRFFPDPEKFIPERFDDENKNNINPYVYVPFGLGPRKCIGNRFALMETKILIVHILKKFNIKFTSKSKYPIVFCKKTFNLNIEGGFWLGLEERKITN